MCSERELFSGRRRDEMPIHCVYPPVLQFPFIPMMLSTSGLIMRLGRKNLCSNGQMVAESEVSVCLLLCKSQRRMRWTMRR